MRGSDVVSNREKGENKGRQFIIFEYDRHKYERGYQKNPRKGHFFQMAQVVPSFITFCRRSEILWNRLFVFRLTANLHLHLHFMNTLSWAISNDGFRNYNLINLPALSVMVRPSFGAKLCFTYTIWFSDLILSDLWGFQLSFCLQEIHNQRNRVLDFFPFDEKSSRFAHFDFMNEYEAASPLNEFEWVQSSFTIVLKHCSREASI